MLNKAIKRMVFKLHFCHSASLHFMAKVQLKNHRLSQRYGLSVLTMKFFIVAISIFVSVAANACDCIGLTVSQSYFRSDLTFVGELVGKQDLCDLSGRKNDFSCNYSGPIVWLVKPIEIYRDTEYQIFRSKNIYENVYIYQSGGMCSAHFELGKKYLIFSKSASNGMNSTNQCMGTKELERSTETIKELNSLKLLVNKNP